MGELTTQLSAWPGAFDTALSLSNADSPQVSHINGVVDAVLKMQADLGIGLKGSVANLRTRIAVNIAEAGGIPSGTNFPGVPTPQQIFWRTDTKELSIYDDALGQWQRVDSSGVHGALSGLLANDHPQYPQKATAETITGAWTFGTSPGLPAGSITSADIADGTIVSADIADGTITSADIADGTIVDGDISPSAAISETKLSANIARLDASAPFTQNQLINKAIATLELLDTGAGTKKARFFTLSDGVAYIAYNASFSGTAWNRDDVASFSWLIRLGGLNNDDFAVFRAPAGANPITWTTVLTIDSAGVQTVGTVPGARIVDASITGTKVAASTLTGGHIAPITITENNIAASTITGFNIAANTIGSGNLKLAPGSASGGLAQGGTVVITMNDHSFFPNISSSSNGMDFRSYAGSPIGAQSLGKFALFNGLTAASPTYDVRWEYITASDDPTVHLVHDSLGKITGVWMSDDPLPAGQFGLSGEGLTSLIIPREDLGIMLTGIPQAKIDKGRKKSTSEDKAPYRIIHEAFERPTDELMNRCKIVGGKLAAR